MNVSMAVSRPTLLPKFGGGTHHLDPVKELLIFLDYLSNQESMRQLSMQFGVLVSTVHGTIRRVNASSMKIW